MLVCGSMEAMSNLTTAYYHYHDELQAGISPKIMGTSHRWGPILCRSALHEGAAEESDTFPAESRT